MAIQDAVLAPRIHHQWRPKELMMERFGFPLETEEALIAMGYSLKEIATSGKMQAIERFPSGRVWGVSDPRTEGSAIAE
jgi:gamma-glutamyltranspeptidase/glutathione hydrolase